LLELVKESVAEGVGSDSVVVRDVAARTEYVDGGVSGMPTAVVAVASGRVKVPLPEPQSQSP
jgi:hypothetical protein